MLCVMCITNSLRSTDKHRVGEEFHKSAQGGGLFLPVKGDVRGTFVFWFLIKQNCAITEEIRHLSHCPDTVIDTDVLKANFLTVT